MFWNSNERKPPEFIYSIKKLTNFDGQNSFYPLVKEKGLFNSWCVIFKVNNRHIVTLPLKLSDNTYACPTEEEARGYMEDHSIQIMENLKDQIKLEQTIPLGSAYKITFKDSENENA